MASRKATKAELAKSVRSGNRKSGVTQSGMPRAGRVAKPAKAERKTANTVGGGGARGVKSTKKSDIAPTTPYQAKVVQTSTVGAGPGTSSGLSEDIQNKSGLLTVARELKKSGALFDEPGSPNVEVGFSDTGVSVLDRKKAPTPAQLEERKSAAKVNQGRQRKSVIEGVQSGRIATDLRSAEARQRFFTDDVDTSPAAVEAAAVTGGKLPIKADKLRTANPPQGSAYTGKRDASGNLTPKEVTRPNSLGKTRSLDRSVDKVTKRNSKEAQAALKTAEVIQGIDETRQGKGSTGRGSAVEGMTKDAVYTTGTAPTASDVGKPYQTIEVKGGSTAALGGPVEATINTAQTAVGRDVVLSKMTEAEKREMGNSTQQTIKGARARTGGYIGGTVGSSEITPEFKANVAKTVAADSKTAIPEDIVDQQGYSFKDLLSDKPGAYEEIQKSVNSSVNRRSELTADPRKRKDSRGSIDAPILEGSDSNERLQAYLATVNPTKRKDIEDQLIAAGNPLNAPITESAEKETQINGTTVRTTVNDTFGKVASANKAVATEVAGSSRRRRGSTRTAPVEAITEQTGPEAARTLAINEATNRIIANDYMQPPSTKPSARSLAGRATVTDPATGQPVTGKGVIAASQRLPLTGSGMAQPTDDQLKIMQTTQPRLAPVFDRRPGQPGAMSITTASGDVGSIPVRAKDGVKSKDNPYGRGTATGESVAFPKAARMPGATSVQFQTPGGTRTGGVVPQAMPTASAIAAISPKSPGNLPYSPLASEGVKGRTPWNSLAPGSQVMVNDGSTGPTSMVRSSQFGNIQGSGGVPATPENVRRAAARPYREAGIAAAKPVAESKRYERLAAAAKPGVDKRFAEEQVRTKTLAVMKEKNLPVRQEATAGLASSKPKQPAPLAEGLAPKNVPTVQASTERPNYSRAERSQMAAQAQSRRDTLAASMGQRASQAESSDAALAAGVSPFAPKTQAMRGAQFNQ